MLRNSSRCSLRPLPNLSLSKRRRYASIAETSKLPEPGDRLHGFSVVRKKHVPNLELTAVHLQHDKTGAEYLHVAKDDKNNVFSIGFKTNPPDHTGVPHILEHLALCGSQKYPVRDPFFKMMPRSLSNFMNAMTYPDHTVYPFATTNHEDFKNLLSVYLDSTLHPLLREHDFAQEGWRLGPENARAAFEAGVPGLEQNPILFKGVVYNEMKGALSNADDMFHTFWHTNVTPDLNNSGGHPQKMTELTYDNLKAFHSKNYHPSNSKIFTYGNIPLESHLQEIGQQLDAFDNSTADTRVIAPISLVNGPKSLTVKGPIDSLYPRDQQIKASVSWMTCDTSDVLETFSMGIIASLLLDGFSSPLYENTIGVGWGANYSPNTGFDSSGKVGIFSVGLTGLKKQDLAQLGGGIKNTLLSVNRTGFNLHKVHSRLHQLEIALKHKTANFGMGLMSRLQDGWFNGIDPLSTVDPETVITAFKEKLNEKGYLEGIFRKYLLNDNTFTFIMEPTEDYAGEIMAEEAQRLEKKIAEVVSQFKSSDDAISHLISREHELLEVQEGKNEENADILPTVHVKDVPRQLDRKEVRFGSIGSSKVQWRETPTNDLTYFRLLQPFQQLPDELRVFLPLFTSAIQRIGTKSMSTEDLEDAIRSTSGGITVSPYANTSPTDTQVTSEGIAYGAWGFDSNVPRMLELLRAMVCETSFDKRTAEGQVAELIKNAASSAANEIADSGHGYAHRFAAAGLTPGARIGELTTGLSQTRFIMDLANRPPGAGYSDILDKFREIQSFLLTKNDTTAMRIGLTCSPQSTTSNESHLEKFLTSLPQGEVSPVATNTIPFPLNEKIFFPLPYQVYYSARGTLAVPYTHADSAPLQILSELLTHKRLHREIREKGGAYGASAQFGALSGIFSMTSYRDPSPLNSLKAMVSSGAWARDNEWTDKDIDEAKLGVFQSVDAPMSVNEEGMAEFMYGLTDELRQERRERLLDVTKHQVRDVAQKYLVNSAEDPHNEVVLGPSLDGLKAADGWIQMPLSVDVEVEDTQSEQNQDLQGGYLVL